MYAPLLSVIIFSRHVHRYYSNPTLEASELLLGLS